MLEAMIVGHGECQEVTTEREPGGKITRLHPKGTRAYLDLSIQGSSPVRIYIPIEKYWQEIGPQLLTSHSAT